MKTSPRDAGKSTDVQALKLTIKSKHAARHADLMKQRALLAKATLKEAKRAFKLARKVAKKAAKKSRRLEEALATWLKRPEPKPKANRKLKPRKPARASGRNPKTRKAPRKLSKPPDIATPQLPIPTASNPLPLS